VTPVSFHDFFGGCATVAGALIGLLFVAISVSPEKLTGRIAEADHQVKAGAAFSALVNTLVIALVALLPGASLGTTVLILSAAGLSSTAGLVIVLWREHQKRVNLGAIIMLAVLLGLYGVQLANGLALNSSPRDLGLISNQGGLVIGFFAFAIARAWALVGARDSHLLSAVAGMVRQPGTGTGTGTEPGPVPPAPPPARRNEP
jgi:hypothetical protein